MKQRAIYIVNIIIGQHKAKHDKESSTKAARSVWLNDYFYFYIDVSPSVECWMRTFKSFLKNPCTSSLEPLMNKHCRTSLRSSWPPAWHDLFALHFPPCLTENYANWIVTQSLMESYLGSAEETAKGSRKLSSIIYAIWRWCWIDKHFWTRCLLVLSLE